MRRITIALLTLFALFASASANVMANEGSDIALITKTYKAYVADFIEGYIAAITNKFTYPVTFKMKLLGIIPVHKTFTNEAELAEQYRDMKADIQEGYAYSTVDNITIRREENTYVADVLYSRFNAEDDLLFSGRGLYSFKDDDGQWKMFVVEQVEK
jgi:hypothetical protein